MHLEQCWCDPFPVNYLNAFHDKSEQLISNRRFTNNIKRVVISTIIIHISPFVRWPRYDFFLPTCWTCRLWTDSFFLHSWHHSSNSSLQELFSGSTLSPITYSQNHLLRDSSFHKFYWRKDYPIRQTFKLHSHIKLLLIFEIINKWY